MSHLSFSIRLWLAIGAFYSMLAIIFSALTTHLPDTYFVGNGRDMARIADNLLAIHGIALIIVSILQKISNSQRSFILVGGLFTVGSLLFCGGVFYIALTGTPPMIAFAPIGGSILILAWLYLSVSAFFIKA